MALTHASKEAIWLRQLFEDLGHQQRQPTVIYEDNKGAIQLANNPVHHKRTKHIDIQYHFIREKVESLEVRLEQCSSKNNLADIFTKLASIAIFSVMVTWLLALVSFIAFKRRGDVDGSVHLPGGSVTAALGVVGVLAVMATAFEVDDMRQAALIGSGWVLVLLAAYALTRAGRARRDQR